MHIQYVHNDTACYMLLLSGYLIGQHFEYLWIILTILPIALSPGASFTLAMANVTNQGMKGLATVILGTALGIYTHALLAGLGISSILEKYPLLIGSIKIIGTLYLVFLSIILIKERYDFSAF